MQDITINYLVVLAATIASFVVGALWYGPLFGKKWMALMGFTPESMRAMKLTPMQAMGLGFVSTLIMAFVLANFAALFGAEGVSGALQLAFWVWLGFIATTLAGSVLWEGKSVKLYVFNIVYQFVSIFVTALVLVLWA